MGNVALGYRSMGVLKMTRLHVFDGPKHFRSTLEDFVIRGPMAKNANRAGVKLPPFKDVHATMRLYARVNHNRWIVDCPTCKNAEFLWPDERLFMCQICWNGTFNGQWVSVEVPQQKNIIEQILKTRPAPQNRNWEIGESVQELRRQNRDHGLPADD